MGNFKRELIRDPTGIINLPSLITQIDLMKTFNHNAGTYQTRQLETQIK